MLSLHVGGLVKLYANMNVSNLSPTKPIHIQFHEIQVQGRLRQINFELHFAAKSLISTNIFKGHKFLGEMYLVNSFHMLLIPVCVDVTFL